MTRSIKGFSLAWLMMVASFGAQAWSPLGPFKSWQDNSRGYQRPGEIGGPMTRFECYRWNVTNVFYAVDGSFLNYFGTRGMQEVEAAFDVLNALPPASAMSADLSEFPQTDMLRENYQAQALGIMDVKSLALEFMVEQMGLADPVRWTWSIRERNVSGANPPVTNYSVRSFNYDPVTSQLSSYINGSLYGYLIEEPWSQTILCDAEEQLRDPVPFANGNPAAVASMAAGSGQYWVGLTRDDVGGLRYLLRPNNYAVETILPGSEVALTNTTVQLLLTNLDYNTFLFDTAHTTNDPATVAALYPGIEITSSNATLSVGLTTNVLFYFTNAPLPGWSEVVTTNRTTNFVYYWDYTFRNVVTNLTNGSIYIVPGNLLGYELITNLVTNIVALTNLADDLGFFVNTNFPIALTTSNLALLGEQARTNSPAALVTIYPDLVVSSSYYQITNQFFTNYSVILSNPPYAPAGVILPFYVPQVTNVLVTNWFHTFANVITNTLFTNSPVISLREEVYPRPFAPAGSGMASTGYVSRVTYSNYVNGSFYIIPTNYVGFQMAYPPPDDALITNSVWLTNVIQPAFNFTNVTATNLASTNMIATNLVASYTNNYIIYPGTNYTFSVYPVQKLNAATNTVGTNTNIRITYYTNTISAVYAIEFQSSTNSASIRPGVDKMHFFNVTRNYDSLIGQFFTPITNQYIENVITNSTLRQQVVRRILGAPDILFVSEDLGINPNSVQPILTGRGGAVAGRWINNDALNGQSAQGGPGVIAPPIRIALTDQLPVFINQQPWNLDEKWATPGSVWGSFDGRTNAPIVYPDQISIQQLEEWILNPPPP